MLKVGKAHHARNVCAYACVRVCARLCVFERAFVIVCVSVHMRVSVCVCAKVYVCARVCALLPHRRCSGVHDAVLERLLLKQA